MPNQSLKLSLPKQRDEVALRASLKNTHKQSRQLILQVVYPFIEIDRR